MTILRTTGRTMEQPPVRELAEHYMGTQIYFNETHGGLCIKEHDNYYTPEELISMLLTHSQDIVKNHGGKAIKDCVITVPTFFTQHERQAVYDAAEIADMKVLGYDRSCD